VINTHFLSGEIIASLYAEKRFAAPQLMVITDFEAHRLWVPQPCLHYFTATEETARYLQCYGVPSRDRILPRAEPVAKWVLPTPDNLGHPTELWQNLPGCPSCAQEPVEGPSRLEAPGQGREGTPDAQQVASSADCVAVVISPVTASR
jgi:hypothetical protein